MFNSASFVPSHAELQYDDLLGLVMLLCAREISSRKGHPSVRFSDFSAVTNIK